MKNLKNFRGFLNEDLFSGIGKMLGMSSPYQRHSEISYGQYKIPVWKHTKTGESWYGHPRKSEEKEPYIPHLLLYKADKLPGLKKAIETMEKKSKGERIDWEDYQSAITGQDMSGTPVPSIFPKEDMKLKNDSFKGYHVD